MSYFFQVYGDKSNTPNLPALRWKLFRHKNLEGESLPPTRSALFQHCLRANGVCKRDKSYTEKCPLLPDYTDCGFKITSDKKYMPVMTTKLPAPEAVLNYVKCGCKTGCKNKRCSCVEAGLNCTPLCTKCYDDDCENRERLEVASEDIPDTYEENDL